MKYFVAIVILLASNRSFSQQWHAAGEKLQEPKSPSGYHITVAYCSRYDTIPCHYISNESSQIQSGYKFVYVKNGYFTDDTRTFQVFYNSRMERINNVERYYFK